MYDKKFHEFLDIQSDLANDFISENSEFADQFTPTNFAYAHKTPIDKHRKQIAYSGVWDNGVLFVNLYDIRSDTTLTFNGYQALKDKGYLDGNPCPTKTLRTPAPKPQSTAKNSTSQFKDYLDYYLTLPVTLPEYVPYFTNKIGNNRLSLINGVRVGKYYNHDVAITPLKDANGEIVLFQIAGDNPIVGDSNKILIAKFEGAKKGLSHYFGADLNVSKRQFIGEGFATVISAHDILKNDLNIDLKNDCFKSAIDSGNVKNLSNQQREFLTDTYFITDNDVINSTNPNSRNTGLITSIECLFKLGLQNEKRILLPIASNGGKCDFNDIEHEENPKYEIISAIDALQRFPILSEKSIIKSTLRLNESCYLKSKNGDFNLLTIKNLITKHLDKPNLTIEYNRGNKVYTCGLICNGSNYFLYALNEYALFYLPIAEFISEKLRKDQSVNSFKGLKESDLIKLQDNALNTIKSNSHNLMELNTRDISKITLKREELDLGKYIPKCYAREFSNLNTAFFVTPMGTGKTEFFSEIVNLLRKQNKKTKILAISPLISLVESLAVKLRLTKYNDRNAQESTQLVTTLHSVINYIEQFEKQTDVVILDEINHILGLFNSNTLKGNTTNLFNRLKNLIKNAKRVYVADAYLSQQSFDFLIELRGLNDAIVVSIEKTESHDKEYTIFEHEDAIDNELLATLENGKRVAVICSSVSKTKDIAKTISLKFQDRKILLINGETTGEQNVLDFLNNPNNNIKKYDVIIYSPAISGGVSFDDLKSTPDFELFCYFMPYVHTASDFMQMIGRFRRKSDINLFIDIVSEHTTNQSLQSLNLANKDNNLMLLELLKKLSYENDNILINNAISALKTEIIKNNNGISSLDKFKTAHSEVELDQKKYARHILTMLLDNAGYKFNSIVSNKNKEAALLSKKAKELVLSEEVENTLNAQPISEFEYNQIRKKHKRTLVENYQDQRFKIENRFKLDLTSENVHYVLTKKRDISMAYNLSIAFLNSTTLVEKTIKEIDFDCDDYKSLTQRKFYLLRHDFYTRLFNALNIKLSDKGFDVQDSKPVTLESLGEFFNWVKQRNNRITAAGFKKLPNGNLRIKWVNDLLRDYGFSINKSTKSLEMRESRIGQIAYNLTINSA
jgi:hypothetical protein